MIDWRPTIETIEKLLGEATDASTTYAALECRLAIERICYERLRFAHGYISHQDLKKWTPHGVIKTLLAEVDASVASTFTWAISEETPPDDAEEVSNESFEKFTFHDIGTQIGFDPKVVERLWNSLSGLALQVEVPANEGADISRYGNRTAIEAKVREALTEIIRISQGSLIASGMGNPETISFDCICGTKNRRRSALLVNGQTIRCINPQCDESFNYEEQESRFERRTQEFTCRKCESKSYIPVKVFEKLDKAKSVSFNCIGCNEKIYIRWLLHQAQETKPSAG